MPMGLVIGVMRALGKAPDVKMLSKSQLEGLVRDAGFVEVQTPDVGAKAMISFLVAKRPE
jgi:hypothetical protein